MLQYAKKGKNKATQSENLTITKPRPKRHKISCRDEKHSVYLYALWSRVIVILLCGSIATALELTCGISYFCPFKRLLVNERHMPDK